MIKSRTKIYKFFFFIISFLAILISLYSLEKLKLKKTLSLKSFTEGNGIKNDTLGIKKALEYARENGIEKIYVPKGKYLIDATQKNNPIIIYKGITFYGEGYSSEFILNPNSFRYPGKYNVFVVESNTTIRNLNINGQKDLIDRSKLTNCDLTVVIGKNDNQQDYHYENIWIHDLIGINKESFGLMTSNGSRNVTFNNIIGYKVEGTPIHIAGDYLTNNLTSNILVKNCTTYQNTWQGISIYGAKSVEINNHQSYQNLGNGLNFEWCNDVDVYNSKSFNNGKAGFGSYGKANYYLKKCLSKNNNTLNKNWVGEITLSSGSWYKGNPRPRGNAGIVEVDNCIIEPNKKKRHLVVSVDKTVNVGTTLPDEITITNSNVETWLIATRDYEGVIRDNSFLPNMIFKVLNNIEPIQLEKISDFNVTSNMSIQKYRGKGNAHPDAVTLTDINNKYGNIFSKYILKPNKLYHIQVRYKALSSNKWIVISRDYNQTAKPYIIILTGNSTLIGQWKIAEGIFKTSSKEQRIQIQYDGNTFPDSIDIDYINVKEIQNS